MTGSQPDPLGGGAGDLDGAGDLGRPGPGDASVVTVSTHVLDATAGQPAAGVRVTLEARGPANLWGPAGDGVTGDDGRFRFPADLARGEYRLTFGSGEYFAARGAATFYPSVIVAFVTAAGHYHVPLLLSPFAYSTYRGS